MIPLSAQPISLDSPFKKENVKEKKLYTTYVVCLLCLWLENWNIELDAGLVTCSRNLLGVVKIFPYDVIDVIGINDLTRIRVNRCFFIY